MTYSINGYDSNKAELSNYNFRYQKLTLRTRNNIQMNWNQLEQKLIIVMRKNLTEAIGNMKVLPLLPEYGEAIKEE